VPAFQFTIRILDPHVAFEEAPELQRPEVHGPDAVIDFFEPHVFPGADGRDIHPIGVPADAQKAAPR